MHRPYDRLRLISGAGGSRHHAGRFLRLGKKCADVMLRRLMGVTLLLVLLASSLGAAPREARATPVFDALTAFACLAADRPVRYANGSTDVVLCTSAVQTGDVLRLGVYTRKPSQVQVQLLFPDGTSAPAAGPLIRRTDKQGYARISLPVTYQPVTSYAQAQVMVTVTRAGHSDVVPGLVTIAQAVPLVSTRLRAHPAGLAAWCPADRLSCSIRNNATLIIRVDTDPGAQVVLGLRYPDGTPISCGANDFTSTSLADAAGIYRCELPIVFQSRNAGQGSVLTVVAQVSLGGYAQTRSLKLALLR